MAMATKRAMVTNGNNTGNCYGKDDGGDGPWLCDHLGKNKLVLQ
jgi:hypothetical protein